MHLAKILILLFFIDKSIIMSSRHRFLGSPNSDSAFGIAEKMNRRSTARLLSSVGVSAEMFSTYKESIGIDGLYERRAKKSSPLRYRKIALGRGGWWSPPENYRLSDAEIASHLTGRETFGIRAPKFTALCADWI